MARIYANENFPLPVVHELRGYGHDVLTVQEAGRGAQLDEDVLAFAISQYRIVLTLNRKHFVALHHLSAQHHGIIVCTWDADYAGLALRIHQAILNNANLSGQLVRINRPITTP